MAAPPAPPSLQMGVIPESSTVYGDLSAEQNLHLSGQMYGMSRALRERAGRSDPLPLGLSDKRHLPVRTFSKGMKQRVSIGCAIIHQPKILFLDEPTSGLDVQSRRLVIDTIRQMNGRVARSFSPRTTSKRRTRSVILSASSIKGRLSHRTVPSGSKKCSIPHNPSKSLSIGP